MQHFIAVNDHSTAFYTEILDDALRLKAAVKTGTPHPKLAGKTLGMIFEKPSNRTRVSFEVGMYQLGGHAVYIQKQDIGMGTREPIEDVSRVLSRYVDAVMIRSMLHSTIETFASVSSVPVINGLSDLHHPCQAVADVLTILEHKKTLKGLKICYVGDGNNVCVSLLQLCQKMGLKTVCACPPGYEPPMTGVQIEHDPIKGVHDADVIYTDVWVSMGQEEETAKRLNAFNPFTVTTDLVAHAKSDVILMHCLPANRGQEVTHEALESKHSVIFDQAENRMHAQKAVLVKLVGV
jgi:ornithine carbamoyltransferase